MKQSLKAILLALLLSVASAVRSKAQEKAFDKELRANPLNAVLDLLTRMNKRITDEGEKEDKDFREFRRYCKRQTEKMEASIAETAAKKEKLQAQIQDLASKIDLCEVKVGRLGSSITQSNEDLVNNEAARKRAAEEFEVAQKDLETTIDVLERASTLLAKEMEKNPAALNQLKNNKNMADLLQSFTVMVDAASLSSSDKHRLVSLVQNTDDASDEDDEDFAAPQRAAYTSHSDSIVDVMVDLKEKAEDELRKARNADLMAKHSHEKMQVTLNAQIVADTKEMADQKQTKSQAAEEKAGLEGDLSMATREYNADKADLEATSDDCLMKASDHDASSANRAEELRTISNAQRVLEESTGGARGSSTPAPSFVQVESHSQAHSQALSKIQERARVEARVQQKIQETGSQVIEMVKRLARDQHSATLMQLSSRINAVMRYGNRDGADPLAKVKTLISELIDRLEREAGEETAEKHFCDKEIGETTYKLEVLKGNVDGYNVKLDQAAAKVAELKKDVARLQGEIRDLNELVAFMTQKRNKQHRMYIEQRDTLNDGLEGVRQALGILRDYYGVEESPALVQTDQDPEVPSAGELHTKSGSGKSIIGLLEVVESDFAKTLAVMETEEADAAGAAEKELAAWQVKKAMKQSDVEFKNQQRTTQEKEISEKNRDLETEMTELDAVLEYDSKIKERCVTKPDSFEERKARREAEIAGLKEAMAILESEAFLQRGHRARLRRNSEYGM